MQPKATPATQATLHPLIAGLVYAGTLQGTTCTLPPTAPVLVGQVPRNAVLAFYRANPANATPTGYAAGTQGYFAYLAWYQAACGGVIVTPHKAKQGGLAAGYGYTNPTANAAAHKVSNPGGPLTAQSGTPYRLSEHALWVLRQVLKGAGQAAPATQAAAPAAKGSKAA